MTKRWTLILIGILVVTLIIIVAVVWFISRNNTYSNQNNILYPFYAAIKPGESTTFLTDAAGNPQIDCSAVGGKINIVGAWAETIDPYSMCANDSSSILNLTCGLRGSNSKSVPCKQDADCGPGLSCTGGVCIAAQCPLNTPKDGSFTPSNCSCGGNYCPIQPGTTCGVGATYPDCNDSAGSIMYCDSSNKCRVNPGQSCFAPDLYTNNFCSLYGLCSNVLTTVTDPESGTSKIPSSVVNEICYPFDSSGNPNTNQCRPRDASAYLAGKCDGQATCPLLFNPSDPTSGFGPSPCNADTDWSKLPYTPGTGSNYSQGYYVHGLYSCS